MKEPGSFSMHGSLDGERPFFELQDELIAAGHDVAVDDGGFGALFLRAEDCEGLLTSRRFGAVALPILYLSGVFEGPLFDLCSVLMFAKDGEEHRRLRSVVAGFFTPTGVERYRPAVEDRRRPCRRTLGCPPGDPGHLGQRQRHVLRRRRLGEHNGYINKP